MLISGTLISAREESKKTTSLSVSGTLESLQRIGPLCQTQSICSQRTSVTLAKVLPGTSTYMDLLTTLELATIPDGESDHLMKRVSMHMDVSKAKDIFPTEQKLEP
eukprot:14243326-Heterocapsa_arctica.AAC.1